MHFFGQIAKLFGQQIAAKNEKNARSTYRINNAKNLLTRFPVTSRRRGSCQLVTDLLRVLATGKLRKTGVMDFAVDTLPAKGFRREQARDL